MLGITISSFVEKLNNYWNNWTRDQIRKRDPSVLSDNTSPTEIREALSHLVEHLPTVNVDELERAFSIAQNISYYVVLENESSTARCHSRSKMMRKSVSWMKGSGSLLSLECLLSSSLSPWQRFSKDTSKPRSTPPTSTRWTPQETPYNFLSMP
ncbi:hypothetical protein NW765_017147 [Fusarium oxysporum]|nr:hypothetical protein NW765_017147 [Fusarium oxysporum]KAJ4256288.1 hypothetical protein NW764_016331 [Fusarium oxysporum]